eukprot:jgi/Bigna1/139811/aug1.52_g14519
MPSEIGKLKAFMKFGGLEFEDFSCTRTEALRQCRESKREEIKVSIHPTVVINIADQVTRASIQFNRDKATGIILGYMTKDKNLHLTDCIEVASNISNSDEKKLQLSLDQFEADFNLYKQAFPGNCIVGWFCTGNEPTPTASHRQFHKDFLKWHTLGHSNNSHNSSTEEAESGSGCDLVFLLMNPNSVMVESGATAPNNGGSKCGDSGEELQQRLPIKIFSHRNLGVPQPFQIVADVGETIAIDHCMMEGNEGERSGSLGRNEKLSK